MREPDNLMRTIGLAFAAVGLVFAVGAADDAKRNSLEFPQLVYRGTFIDGATGGAASLGTVPVRKQAVFRAYDGGESSARTLWTSGPTDVDVETNGAFEVAFGDLELCGLIVSGAVSHVGMSLCGPNGRTLSEITPRRELRPVAAANRALIAEGAASDISIGTLSAKTLTAPSLAVRSLEASVAVTGENVDGIGVNWFTVNKDEVTRVSGREVVVFGSPSRVATAANPVRGQALWTARGDGMVLVHTSSANRETLRIPGVVQYVRAGDVVRAPCTEHGDVSVEYYPFAGRNAEGVK